ncbi:Sbno2 [Gossypium arboreum]|uniref:Sbno2 n=1 Tax=Gossypium arboreum TaxID=29729 RepID=A0A0B0NMX2_GOSAR|nr:Sbno2 [Gossypium arboreum]
MQLDFGIQRKERIVSALELQVGKNKNSRTQLHRIEQSSGKKFGCLQLFDITHRKKDGSPMTTEATEIMEKLKDKRAEYEAVASSDSSVNLEDIDNQVIPEVSGPERYGRI